MDIDLIKYFIFYGIKIAGTTCLISLGIRQGIKIFTKIIR